MYRKLIEDIKKWKEDVPDPSAALQNYRDLQAGTMSEIAKQGAVRGLGGGSGISAMQQLQAAREGQEGAKGLTIDWQNQARQHQLSALNAILGAAGGAAGLGSNMAGLGPQWYNAINQASNAREQNQIDWYRAIEQSRWQPLQFMGGLISALGGLI